MALIRQTEYLRRAVLDASLELIEAEGLGALSMREVARRAGVSHQAPYHHFGDREGILAAICAEGFELLRDEMRAAIMKAGALAEDQLQAIGRTYLQFAQAHPAHFKLMFTSDYVSDDTMSLMEKKGETAFDLLVAVVDRVMAARLGRADRAFALMAWGLAHGIATLKLSGKLKHHFGPSEKAQMKAAQDALDAFGALLRQRA